MVKYKVYFNKMLEDNKDVFDRFSKVQNQYQHNNRLYQNDLNTIGTKILEIIKDYENKLCSNTERGTYNIFSGNLAEKFQSEVRKHFPYIDYIGLKTINTFSPFRKNPQPKFSLKKINLN